MIGVRNKLHIPTSTVSTIPVQVREKTRSLVIKRISITNGLTGTRDKKLETEIVNTSLTNRYEVYKGNLSFAAYLRDMNTLMHESGYGQIANIVKNPQLIENTDPRIERIRTRSNATVINHNNRNGVKNSKDREKLKWLNLDLKLKVTYDIITVEKYEQEINNFLKSRGYNEIDSAKEEKKRGQYLKPGMILNENVELIETVPSKSRRNNKDWKCRCRVCEEEFVADSLKVLRIKDCGCVRKKAKEKKIKIKEYPHNFYNVFFKDYEPGKDRLKKDPIKTFSPRLSKNEIEILSLLYVEKHTMAQIGDLRKVTRQNINQIKTRAILKLRAYSDEIKLD